MVLSGGSGGSGGREDMMLLWREECSFMQNVYADVLLYCTRTIQNLYFMQYIHRVV